MTSERPILYLSINNHFDPTWRRCWDKRFEFKGQTFVSYADLEEYYLLDNLALAEAHAEYKFEAEFSLVVQKFFERQPERLEELRRLGHAGRFAVTGGGQVIVDANLITGESLVRNYLVGLLWVEQTLGQSTHIGVRNDGFGNSAQLPQILRGVELDWATGMSYSPALGRYWRGLDGSTILVKTLPEAGEGGGVWKYVPCPACHGTGTGAAAGASCAACNGRGIQVGPLCALPGEIEPLAFEPYGAAWIKLGPEELLPNPALIDWAKAHQGEYDVRFALEQDLSVHLRHLLDRVDTPPEDELHPGVELNPNNTGVYVTRIRTKQTARRQEHALLSVEWLHALAAAGGYAHPAGHVHMAGNMYPPGHAYPSTQLERIWKDLLFTMFHDAITATHVDPSYTEIQEMWARIDSATAALCEDALVRLAHLSRNTPEEPGALTLLNPGGSGAAQICTLNAPVGDWQVLDESGQELPISAQRPRESGGMALDVTAAVPAYGARRLRIVPAAGPAPAAVRMDEPMIENERFRVRADEHGMLEVYDRALRRAILTTDEGTPAGGSPHAAAYRPGELILEHDEGSPWATLHPDQTRTPLAASTRLLEVWSHPAYQRMVFAIDAPFRAGFVADGFSARMEVTLYAQVERVDFHLDVHWNTYNHRLRAAFPIAFNGRHLYEIPYGVLERSPYAPNFHWAGAAGDWPAIHWAGVEGADPLCGVAVFNRGIPSYQIEAGRDGAGDTLLLSLLRSPAVPTYLHEPSYYTMTEFDGMRDAGQHSFDFALAACAGSFAGSSAVLDAESYNRGLIVGYGALDLPAMPELISDCARIAAHKWAETGDALVLRLAEFRGIGGDAQVSIPSWARSVSQVNLLERQATSPAVLDGLVHLSLRPWEIATLRFERRAA